MLRKGLILFALLALVLATASPALADRPEKEREQVQVQEQVQVDGLKLPKAFQGVVVSVGDEDEDGEDVVDRMVVETAKWGELTIVADENTQIKWPQSVAKRVFGEEVDLSVFAEDDRVVVQLASKPEPVEDAEDPEEPELLARAIHLVPGQTFVHYTGKVEAVGDTLTVKKGDGESRVFNLVDATEEADGTLVFRGKEAVDQIDIKVGQVVTVVARACGEDVCDALSVVIHSKPKGKNAAESDVESEEDADSEDTKGKSAEAKGQNKPGKSNVEDVDDQDGDDEEEDDEQGAPQGKGKGLLKTKPNRAS